MADWMLPAWQGWRMLITNSKLPAVLLAAVFYLLMSRKYKKTAVYGAVTAVLCILPGTAAILMKYQTAFYDYPFVWSIVPMTALIALGGTCLLEERLRRKAGFRGIVFNCVLVGLCAIVLFMSGGTGTGTDIGNRSQAEAVLREVRQYLPAEGQDGTAPCLWAPRDILEAARMTGGGADGRSFTLLYGRNMWDKALNAYTYDVYSEELKELYTWMEEAAQEDAAEADEEQTEAKQEDTAQEDAAEADAVQADSDAGADAGKLRGHVEKAFSLGADCVLLPKTAAGFDPQSADWVRVVELDEYYLLMKV